jgi:hypothetical protein
MTDTSSTQSGPTKPETWEQEAWDKIEEAEQWVISDLHDIGVIFADDVWPAIKAALVLLGTQLGSAVLAAVTANIADPTLIPSAVGAALVTTASVSGVTDAQTALASAQAAVAADPTVQALLPGNGS